MGLTKEQIQVLNAADKTGMIRVCDDSPEAEACLCGRLTKP